MTREQPTSLLIVDDDAKMRRLLIEYLGARGACATAETAEEAMNILLQTPFQLMIADIERSGDAVVDLCRSVTKAYRDTVVILMSGSAGMRYVMRAMREGAYDCVLKPVRQFQAMTAVERGLRHQALRAAVNTNQLRPGNGSYSLTNSRVRPPDMVPDSITEGLYNQYRDTLRAIDRVLNAHKAETRSLAVLYSVRLGRELGIKPADLIALQQGALLHDFGKLGLPDDASALSEYERTRMGNHVLQGLRIIAGIEFLAGARFVVGQHHERFDGGGYPVGLSGDSIHINARIFALADAFDLTTGDRGHRPAQPYQVARAEIEANRGRQFDPEVVDAFLEIGETEWTRLRDAGQSSNYIDQAICKEEIVCFMKSLKRDSSSDAGVPTAHQPPYQRQRYGAGL